MRSAVAGLGAGRPSEEAAGSRDGCREEASLSPRSPSAWLSLSSSGCSTEGSGCTRCSGAAPPRGRPRGRPVGGAVATLATRRARRSAREPAMAVSSLKTRLSPLPGAPNVEELSQEQWAYRGVRYRQGAEHGIKQPSTCHGDGARRVRRGAALQRRTHDVTQVQGPLVEVKPLRPALSCIALLGEVHSTRRACRARGGYNG